MRCPACDEKIGDGVWICPHCEHIIDASFLGNDITNEDEIETIPPIPPPREPTRDMRPETADLVFPPEPPTDGLDVEQKMIVASLDDEPRDKVNTRPLPPEELDPSALEEVPELPSPPPMVIAQPKKKGLPALKRPEPTGDLEVKKRDVLSRAMARGPIQERRATGASSPSSPAPPSSSDIVRSSKAEKIFQQAIEDMAAGNLISARTNLKLALTFDPGNERYKEKLAEVEQEGGPNLGSQDLEEVPKGTQFANQFYEKAIEQENQGNFDEAIRLLEKAIRADAQGVYYHRLGNILAFHKGQLKEGRNMVDKAIQRSPRNKNYQKTLSRILERMNGGEEKKNMANMLGGLLKRK